ncbi:MAG TPA: TIGR04290 family methyltransferase [Chloroflexia bacterium]|nr:TIGR04290 family methyltransferase [Chloroflexia bacterium]
MSTKNHNGQAERSIVGVVKSLGPWFHNLHLPDGTQTAPDHPLGDFPRFKWESLAPKLPLDLRGWSVLDIGCNGGFYTFALASRGAKVTGIDVNEHYLRQARWAAAQFGLADRTTFKRMQIYDLAHVEETYDLVLFMGVFYHLRYPMLGLDIVSQKVGRIMVFQTLTMPGMEVYEKTSGLGIADRDMMLEAGWPKMAFIEGELAGDFSNWWAPNHAAVEAMLRSAGMKLTQALGDEIYLCEPDKENPSSSTTWNVDEYLAATHARRHGADRVGDYA